MVDVAGCVHSSSVQGGGIRRVHHLVQARLHVFVCRCVRTFIIPGAVEETKVPQ